MQDSNDRWALSDPRKSASGPLTWTENNGHDLVCNPYADAGTIARHRAAIEREMARGYNEIQANARVASEGTQLVLAHMRGAR